jgi:RimJ/RimL family protein N-acetyltransferase
MLKTETYHARPLLARDVYDDFVAVMSSFDSIRATRGGSWPTSDLTFEEDFIDLAWHEREFTSGYSYAYVLYSADNTEYLGCIYIYPPDRKSSLRSVSAGDQASISWWVTDSAWKRGFYETLSHDIKAWVEADWPFAQVNYANTVLPEGF